MGFFLPASPPPNGGGFNRQTCGHIPIFRALSQRSASIHQGDALNKLSCGSQTPKGIKFLPGKRTFHSQRAAGLRDVHDNVAILVFRGDTVEHIVAHETSQNFWKVPANFLHESDFIV
jgi:hypothetical protein